jgi:hypothetical protein
MKDITPWNRGNRHIGSSLADFLPGESILVDARAVAIAGQVFERGIEEALAFYLQNDPSDKSAEEERH